MSGKHHRPPWWCRGRGAGRQVSRLRQGLSEMVEGAGEAYLVTSEAFEQGLREAAGRYVALCGRRIIAASLATRPQRYCRPCQVLPAWS